MPIRSLKEIDASAAEGQGAWRQLARDFRDIRDSRFAEMGGCEPGVEREYKYRAVLGNRSFDKYLRKRWGLTRKRVDQMIEALEIAEKLGA
jgi:hypothetical protein